MTPPQVALPDLQPGVTYHVVYGTDDTPIIFSGVATYAGDADSDGELRVFDHATIAFEDGLDGLTAYEHHARAAAGPASASPPDALAEAQARLLDLHARHDDLVATLCQRLGIAQESETNIVAEVTRLATAHQQLNDRHDDSQRVVTENYNALWALVYPDGKADSQYPGQIINHLRVLLEEKDAALQHSAERLDAIVSAARRQLDESPWAPCPICRYAPMVPGRMASLLSVQEWHARNAVTPFARHDTSCPLADLLPQPQPDPLPGQVAAQP